MLPARDGLLFSSSYRLLLASVAAACLCLARTSLSAPQPPPSRKAPAITYVAGPHQLTLLIGDKGAYRLGYETDNQFRAERRFPNGTVAGIHAHIRADGVPAIERYGAFNDLGLKPMKEIVPESVTISTTDPTTIEPETNSTSSDDDTRMRIKDLDALPEGQVVDEERNSIWVEADFSKSADYADAQGRQKFVYPKIDLSDFFPQSNRKVRSDSRAENRVGYKPSPASLPEPVPIAAPATVNQVRGRHLVVDQNPGEPAIIYSNPNQRYRKTVRAQYAVQ